MPDHVTLQTTLGTLLRTHRNATGLTQKTLAQRCQLSPVYISRLEKGAHTPSVQACHELAAALDCPVESLALLVYEATVPQDLQAVVHPGSVAVAADPLVQECLPVLTALRPLPPATRHCLLQLWQAMVLLMQGSVTLDTHHDTDPNSAEAYATTPVY